MWHYIQHTLQISSKPFPFWRIYDPLAYHRYKCCCNKCPQDSSKTVRASAVCCGLKEMPPSQQLLHLPSSQSTEKPWTLHHTLQITGIIKHFDTDKLIYKICLDACFPDGKGRHLDIHSSRLHFFGFPLQSPSLRVWGNTLCSLDINPLPVTCASHILSSWLSIL